MLVPHEAPLSHPYKGPHGDVRASSPAQGRRTWAPDLFPRGRSTLSQTLFHPGTFFTVEGGAPKAGCSVRGCRQTTAPTPRTVQVLPGTRLCPGGSGQTPGAQLLPPQTSHAGWHCCFNSPGFILHPPPSSPAIAPRLVAGWGALWNHRKISPCLALWPPFRNSKQSRNDRMEAPSLPGTPLCPELVLLSLQEEKAGVVGVGMRGRASGPASNYLRKSQDECPRQRLLISLLAHAPLSFPEPSCVMMSQQGPW